MKKRIFIALLVIIFAFSGCADPPADVIWNEEEAAASSLVPAGDIVSLKDTTYGYEVFRRQAEQLKEKYTDIVSLYSIGQSVYGREILCLVLGNAQAENKLLLAGAIRGTQYWTTQLLMKQIETYCENLSEAYEGVSYREIFQNCAVYFVPMVNPDGVEICFNGLKSVPQTYQAQIEEIYEYSLQVGLLTKETGYKHWKANGQGIDIGINFGVGTVESAAIQKQAASENYPGEPLCTPEAAAIAQLCEEQNFSAAAVYTEEGNLIDWAFGQKESFKESERYADALAELTGYTKIANGPTPEVCTSVSLTGWFISQFDKPAFAILMGKNSEQLSLSKIWSENCLVPILLAWQLQQQEIEKPVQTPTAEYNEIE